MTAAVRARLCATYAALLPAVAAVSRRSGGGNGIGGRMESVTVVEASLRARVSPVNQPSVTPESGRVEVVADYTVFLGDPLRLPETLDVKEGDRISVDGQTFIVLSTDRGRGDAIGLQANCRREG